MKNAVVNKMITVETDEFDYNKFQIRYGTSNQFIKLSLADVRYLMENVTMRKLIEVFVV